MMMTRRQKMWRMGIVGWVVVVGGLIWGASGAKAQVGPGQVQVNQNAKARAKTSSPELGMLASRALSEDPSVGEPAITGLRQRGQEAVSFLMNQPELRKSPHWAPVLDAVAQQKDAQYSGLYWHTDLEQALAAAKREKKPVLSFRLLGNLTDELSCANSRFFRTTLYPNPAVRELLANQFVLHWQSVRAVPIITIDFGDGRQIRRTITGNSLHLVLDEQGRPIDLLPGLYAAAPFIRTLQQVGPAAVQLATLSGDEFQQQRSTYHRDRVQALSQSWQDHCQRANISPALSLGVDHPPEIWTNAAVLAGNEPVLNGEARRAVAERGPAAAVANKLAMSKAITETPLMKLVRNLSRVIREDSVRNEYYLHVQIHNWFAGERPAPAPMPERDALVSRVYADLFLSPLNDPWYGLSQPDVFSAIQNNGQIGTVSQNTGTQNTGR
jgi:hypothetical protein